MLTIWTNDSDYVIAKDEADAVAILVEMGMDASEAGDMETYPEHLAFKVHNDDGTDETHLPSEWAALLGRGYFASSDC